MNETEYMNIPDGTVVVQSDISIRLLPQKAIYLPDIKTALVADVHIGKAASFRSLGVPVPGGTTDENLQRLSQVIELTGAESLYILGDLFHAAAANQESILAAVGRWRNRHANTRVVLVDGNHDIKARVNCDLLGIQTSQAPTTLSSLNGAEIQLHHEPVRQHETESDSWRFCGHWHPVFRVVGKSDALRLPCFWRQGRQWVLPAFGEFTGGHPIEPSLGDGIYLTDGSAVFDASHVMPGLNR
jgi:uncharacterized protein